MRKITGFGFGMVLLCGLSGCGSSGPEGTMKELISTFNEMASTIETVKDENSGEAAAAKLKKLAERAKDLTKKMEAYKLSPDEEKKLKEKYKTELEDATKKVFAAKMQAAMKAPKAMKKIGETMQNLK